MATITQTQTQTLKQRPKLVCFSFAAYAKTLIDHLKSCNIPVQPGLSETELISIERIFTFTFPPDLRSILREGLPVGHGFPNWRSSSSEQLLILMKLPHLGLLKEVENSNFWCSSWGVKPDDNKKALALAMQTLSKAPVLVPVYRDCYIPATPSVAGNPVFHVNGGDVSILSFDVCRFFQEFEFFQNGIFRQDGLSRSFERITVPAWAATAARRVEFWSDVAETVANRDKLEWWSGNSMLTVCMEDVYWRLRNGGWKEEDVREMTMTTMGGKDQEKKNGDFEVLVYKEDMLRHLRVMAVVLLQAGWPMEDVVYSLGYNEDDDQ